MTTALLVELAWKSTLTLGATLVILRLLRHRSAAERSWLAHAGLLATLALPIILLAAPRWEVEAPAPVVDALAPVATGAPAPVAADVGQIGRPAERAAAPATDHVPAFAAMTDEVTWVSGLPAAVLIYALPAALLLGLTLVAIFRLVGLKRRASVMVENEWLSALAQAQRRMGFKHGTALLVSPDIRSPVSWGVMRPVILLNEAAIGSQGQAEAIIAHELAHVARFDWAKLLLARVTAALFWFNPLVWVLTKHCHQLREESADDAVLAHDVPDLDYAELLVGVARHESGALLLAANGVAPSRGSLAQRVARVLDTSRRRAPARFAWTAAVTGGAALVAAPLAALSLGAAPAERATVPQRLTLAQAPAAPVVRRAAGDPGATSPTAVASSTAPAASPLMLAHAIAAALPVTATAAATVASAAPAAAPPAPPAPPAQPAAGTAALIELPPFNAIAVNAGGTIILRHGARQQVRVIGGSADAVRFAVAGGNLAINGCGGDCKNIVVELVMPEAPEALAVHGGGAIQARGAFPGGGELAIAIHGGGSIDVLAIAADDVAAAIRGGGMIETRARQELAANITGGGAIRYRGDPELATAIQGGGTVMRLGD